MVGRLVAELCDKRIVLVPMAIMCQFLIECERQHIICMGGAFAESFTSQYIYL